MSAPEEFDIGPLTWVKGEIEQALVRSGEAIAAYAANPLDTTQLKYCKTHLHQAHGALEIVGLDGVTRLTEECERLIDALDGGVLPMSQTVAGALTNAFKALGAYLDDLVEGAPHQPVRLFAPYRDVMAARGADRILESDLFFPDLSPRPPRREATEAPADMLAYVAGQRRRFQSGLLRWLRNAADNGALREMTEAVRAIERTQAMAQHRAFWWVTIGFTESLIAVGAQAGLEAKRLCARIDLQMKRLMEGSQNVAERLLRDTLYFVARSRVQSAQVQEIRRVYALDRAIPDAQSERRDLRPHEAELRVLREIIAVAKDKWNRFCSGQAHELAGFQEQAARLRDGGGALDNPDFSMLTSAIASVAAWAGDNPGKVTESIALEIATALLLAESAVEGFARLSPQFPQQVVAVGARLEASLAGLSPSVPPPVLDEMSRKAQERLVMAQVVAEIRSNLATIESVLDGFFRDSGRRAELPTLEGQLRQVSGALSILGAERAVEVLGECRAEIARFADAQYVADVGEFEKVARSLSVLGFYVDALQYGPADFDAFMQPVAPRRARAPDEETTQQAGMPAVVDLLLEGGERNPDAAPAASVEDELAAQRRDARTLFDAWRDKPDDSLLAAELKANLEAIAQDADLVDERGLQQSAGRALELLDQGSGQGLADIEAAMAEVAPDAAAAALPAPSAEVRALAQSSDEVVDAELLAIFLEEAREVLDSIGTQHNLCKVEPSNRELPVTMRRGFHTLKGSGRMVGLARLGEAAWAVEQVMNQWLQEGRLVDADLLSMVGAAHGLFSGWVADLAARGASGADGSALVAACDRMRAGAPFVLVQAAGRVAVSTAPDGASREHSIVIGDMRLSPSLYGIFVEEAASHLAVMRSEVALLAREPQPPRDQLVRSAHTLAGIAGTVNFRRLHVLARAFERALLVARSAGIVPDPDAVALLSAVVEANATLVEAVRELREPPPVLPLEDRVEALRAAWLAASGESDPSALHIEAPPLDEGAPIDAEESLRDNPAGAQPLAAFEPAVAYDTSMPSPVVPDAPTPMAPAPVAGVSEVDFDFSPDDTDASVQSSGVDFDLTFGDDVAATDAAPPVDAWLTPAAADAAVPHPSAAVDFEFDAPANDDQAAPVEAVRIAPPPVPPLPDLVMPELFSAPEEVDFEFDIPSSHALSGLDPAAQVGAGSQADAADATTVDPAVMDPAAMDPAAMDPAAMDTAAMDPAVMDPSEYAQGLDFDFDDADAGVLDIALDGDDDASAHPVPGQTDRQEAGTDIAAQASAAPVMKLPDEEAPAPVAETASLFAPALTTLAGVAAVAAVSVFAPAAEPAIPESAGGADVVPGIELPSTALVATPAPAVSSAEAAPPAAPDSDALSVAELRARGFDPAERLLERINDEIDPQLLPIFLEEAAELVPLLGQQLRAWFDAPGDARNSRGLQRTLHTLKGSARMAGAMAIGQVTHSMESRVESALEQPVLAPAMSEGLMASCDRINALLESLRAGSPEQGADVAGTASAEPAQAVVEAGSSPVREPMREVDASAALPPAVATEFAPSFVRSPERLARPVAPATAAAEGTQRALLRVRSDLVDRLVNEAGEVAIARSRIEGEMRGLKAGLKDLTESVARLRAQLREIEIAAESQMQSRQRDADEKHQSFDPLEFDRFTRFQEITRMMAESVNDVATVQQSLLKNVDDADLAILAQARLNRDLQGGLMRVRMVPFNNVAERLYRVVRQTAKELGKRANLDIGGLQTEIDRSVLERMTGPFEHLLRNAIVHGIEDPAARRAAGKNEIGQITLNARQEGNEYFLVFQDDGRGLDLERIRARALATGLARAGDKLADAQIADFIFMPGFSTADSVSAVAGRGVGMDVVRAEVAALGGRIDTDFTAGGGTRFTIALPLTLAVTQVVLVRAGGQVYAIASVTVEQVRKSRAEELAAAHGQGLVRWQERDYPLFYLPRLLGDSAQRAQAQRFTPVLLVRSGTQRTAIHVDELIGNQEVVVKNIGPQLARVTGIAGATVLGNGRIVLILNPVPLAAGVLSSGAARIGPDGESDGDRPVRAAVPTVMVIDDSLTVRKITSRLLMRENYEVLTARDGVDALEQLQTARPDILLVDIEMPRMDGFDLTRNVRADRALKHIPIIIITSRTAEKHRKFALDLGANLFLGKPFQEEELLDGIAALLRHAETVA